MARKYIQKALSVGLSLTLCAGLVVPSFAATFMDLQHAVNGELDKGTQIEGTDHYGYGSQVEGSDKYEIEAWNDEDGTRNVQLNANVTRVDDDKYVGLGTNKFNTDDTLNLDLNGHTVDAKGQTAFQVNSGNVTIQDNSAEKTGKITGSTGDRTAGVVVGGSGNVTLKDVTITGNGTGVWVAGAAGAAFTNESGKITGNDTGVLVNENGTSAALNGGVVDDGLTVDRNATVEINGGSVLGEVTVGKDANVKINGGTFSDLGVKEYLGDDRGLLSNGNDTYDVVEHDDDHHTFGNSDVCQVEGCDEQAPVTDTTPDAPVVTPAAPAVSTPNEPGIEIDDPVISIDDPAVPLAAGPVTCGEFIDYLWRHEGEPEADIVVDHEYAPAISWALSIGILPDEGFEPDELVTVAMVREILTNYAQYLDMAMPELTTLTGEADEAVLNCDEVLAEFFGEERSQ